ncbi:guanine deaminase [Spirulina sp. CS-785/01]|uniref:guanine deaminase n=1 Tax=Spirulina sp. CS-785/01 TaxID=3021716 RepID=UPI0023301F4B|nr:guanine deaminase [Spirulina sp. CS-785/01]MDB9313007.1 guanine deaminase [Spirulina sp. CS-785/01]
MAVSLAQNSWRAFRGAFLDFLADPFFVPETEAVRYLPDGLLVLENGIIRDFGDYSELTHKYPQISVTDYTNKILMPGFVDTHIHFPQTEIIASYGEQLLEWLNKYTFPTEAKFKDWDYGRQVARFFLEELIRNGTTTALVFATVHPESVEAFFTEAQARNLRMIAGKVMMNRHGPNNICDTVESSYQDSKRLIEKWHKKGRLLYAITPRFAITSTEEQLKIAGQLLQEFPDVYLQTHLSENLAEIEWVKELFPNCENYLAVYDQAGLVQEKAVFAHGIHLTEEEFARLSEAKAAIAFCPTSNLFLGSGLFNLAQAKSPETPVKVGLGTDVGGGTSFSMFQTANEAYKVAQLRQQNLSPLQALFLATLGGAQALALEEKIGNFETGKEADFIVVDHQATPLLAFRNRDTLPPTVAELAEHLFALLILGDDRAITATYIMGEAPKTS